MTKTQTGIVAALAIVIIIGGAYLAFFTPHAQAPTVTQDPAEQGQATYTNASENDIVVTLPFPGAVTGKEFSVIGKARGYWFFEASFPVYLYDEAGNELAVGLGSPEPEGTEWMTTEFVSFKATVTAPQSYIGKATLVLKRDNPSGEPQNDASVTIPITVEY
jgi:hypothetical protein